MVERTMAGNLFRLILPIFAGTLAMEFQPTPPVNCFHSSCQMSGGNPEYCYCDSSCETYGDCCHDASVAQKTTFNPKFSCQRELRNYWMITTCSRSWIAEQLVDGVVNVNDIVSSCEDPSVRASYRFLPPVTDEKTGFVYGNEYCARCNGLNPSNVTGWRVQLSCNETEVGSTTSLLFSELIRFCSVLHYTPPSSSLSPRTCKPLPLISRVISSCPTGTSVSLAEKCSSRGLNFVQYDFGTLVYANEHCATCWGQNPTMDDCLLENPVQPTAPMEVGNIAILFDIFGTGRTAVSSSVTYNIVEEVCPSGSVYDVFRGACRMLPSANCTNSTAITLEGGAYSLIGSNIVFWISYNLNVSIESVNTNGRPIVCIPSVESSTCVPIILSSSEYGQRDNISGTLVVVPSNVSYMIEGYDAQGRPLICTNFTQTRNRTTTSNLFAYPIAFDILTYIGFCIDFASASLFLLTFILFKELRTFFSKLMVNFMVSIILGDTVFLIGGPLFALLNLPPLCTTVAILLHYAFLCRFSWMTVMGSELVRSFYNIKKLNKGAAENWKLLSLYMLVGWLSPLVIVIPTIIVNFTVDNSVNYGVGNSCWINGIVALVVAFVVPVGVSIVLNIVAFIIVMVMVACIRNRPMASSFDPQERRKQLWKDVRFAIAVLSLTGLSWLFGFLALLSRDLSWAWYPFIIINSTQALAVSVAFLFTKKVFRLYRSLFCCTKMRQSKSITTSKPHTTNTKF